MDINKLQHVVGAVKQDAPAEIRFFGAVDQWNVETFNAEFLWLQNEVKPAKIIVRVNSEGGSVVHGMQTYSIIEQCPIEVDCVVEGIAASMGSVIWAAGKNLFMKDYSILMIHSPFIPGSDPEDKNCKAMSDAFRKQLCTIYTSRFGLSEEEVNRIMDGEEGVDGTYIDARKAVECGIIPESNVISTCRDISSAVRAALDGGLGAEAIRGYMSVVSASGEDLNPISAANAIPNKKNDNENNMNNDPKSTLDAVVAVQLGMPADSPMEKVSARLGELIKAEAGLKEANAKLEETRIQLKGKETEVSNLQTRVTEAENALKVYKEAEEKARAAEIEALLDDAVKEGRISADAKESWSVMASQNLDLVKKTIASIAPRVKVSEAIASDPENVKAAEASMKTTEQELAEKVKAVVGDKFNMLKFD